MSSQVTIPPGPRSIEGSARADPYFGKLDSLQASRGVAALLVVVCHVSSFVGQIPELWHRYEIYEWLRGTALGVQLFFVLSGIVIFGAHRKDLDRPSTTPAFYWKRFRRVYPLYWFFFLLTVLWHNTRTGFEPAYQRDPWVIVSGALLVHLFSNQSNMLVAWTLFDEVMFYFAFSTLLLHKRAGAVILTLWMAASFFFLSPAATYWASIFSPNHLLFGMGIGVAMLLERKDAFPGSASFWCGMLLFAGCVLMAGHTRHGLAVRLLSGIGAAGILFGAAVLERRGKLVVPAWLVFLGDASYSVYLAHFMVVSTVAHLCFSLWGHSAVPIVFWMLLLFICGTSAGIITHLVVERPLLRLLKRV